MTYGVGDASFQAAGGEAGLRKLVDLFYDLMDSREVARVIRAMHPADLSTSRDKLATFLCGWLGGPRLYQAKYGGISIPGVHAHLAVDAAARDAWLAIMAEAVAAQDWDEAFKIYLMRQLAVPAERVRVVCEQLQTESKP
ncbi:MAG: group II truncated hemoglobin [Gammaproteobacteria bacterium]|nr:group II truncated hemoglobin [Gammaproteobacteria bacterium]